DSPAQALEVFRRLGIELESTEDAALAGCEHPVAELLRQYRAASKRCSTYGKGWFKRVAPDGRIYPDWHQIGTITGRMSCTAPNLQNLPRDRSYRRCFIAPPGKALVRADWSQLHLRIIAGVAPEPAMGEAFCGDTDIHTLTARRLTGRVEVTKQQRQL